MTVQRKLPLLFTLVNIFVFSLIEANSYENTENSQILTTYNYAPSFPYEKGVPLRNTQGFEEDTQQRQIPFDFSNRDDQMHQPKHDSNEEFVKPKPVLKYTNEQLELPNPYLVNSNIPKDGSQTPLCSTFYPCKISNSESNKNDVPDMNTVKKSTTFTESSSFYQPDLTSHSITENPLPSYNSVNYYNGNDNEFFNSANKQTVSSVYHAKEDSNFETINPNLDHSINNKDNDIKYHSKDVTVICYDNDCVTKVKTSSDCEPSSVTDNLNGESQQKYGPTNEFIQQYIKNLQSKILNAIISDLEIIEKNPDNDFNLANSNNYQYQYQDPKSPSDSKKITREDILKSIFDK